ncbi:MAG: XRE family transcriptional regulator [Anaerolineales bacterium]|jgi:transcriptional regulator with XRE-family HTH domain|nr:XRE family transcriptional regulator [Anaerolineales bacterium]
MSRKPAAFQNLAITSEINVGQRLRELRRERGYSIRELAERSSLAINTLSLIENNKTSPSVSTLQLLAGALGITITSFFDLPQPKQSVIHTHRSQRPRVNFQLGMLEDLGAGFTVRLVEPFLVTLEPGARSGSRWIVHTGQEFVYCLEGQVDYEVEEQSYQLTAGDSLLFEAHLPHRWKNTQSSRACFLLILRPSDESDRPTDQHFTIPAD